MLERTTSGVAGVALEREQPHSGEYSSVSQFLPCYQGTIALCVLTLISVAAAYVVYATPIYTARAQLLIEAQYPQLLLRENSTESRSALDGSQVESQIEVLRSDEITGRVIDAQKLLEDPEFQDSQRFAFLRRLLGQADPAEPSLDERRRVALRKLQEKLDIRRVGISYVLDVAFASPDREKAARLANAIADGYLRDIVETRSRAARLGSLWLEERVAELRTQMSAAARKVQEFRAHHDYRIAGRGAGPGAAGQNGTAEPASASEPTTLEELESKAHISRTIYENFNLAFTDAVQKASYPASNARIISPATIPLRNSHPKTVLILALGALVGSLAGFGLALLRGSIEQPVRSAQQVREETGLECLLVPQLGVGATAPLLVRTRRAIRRLVDRSEHAQPAYAFAEVLDAPRSPFSDGIKRVKTAVSLTSRAHPLRCIGVISSSPREGKTTVAANLAALFAVSGARTLLVDADLGNATLSRALAAGADKGLREVLDGSADVADCIVHVKRMGVDLLPVATNGVQPANPHILASERTAMLFRSISENYAMIIVDLPPLRPVADALAVSAVLDGVILIAEWETPLPVVAETMRSLRIAQAGVIGSVLTKVNVRAAYGLTPRSSRYFYPAN